MLPDPNTAQSIGWLVLVAFCLAAGINQVHAVIKRHTNGDDHRQVGPQPFVVKPETEFVNKRDFDIHVAEVRRERDQLHARLNGMERGLREEMKADVEKIHEKVNLVNLAVARVETETRSQSGILAQLREDIHDALQRK